jgi:hypothetical protein
MISVGSAEDGTVTDKHLVQCLLMPLNEPQVMRTCQANKNNQVPSAL